MTDHSPSNVPHPRHDSVSRRCARPLACALALLASLCAIPLDARAAGTLRPVGSAEAPIEIVDHQVDVVIQNGFARTQVTQVFRNPNPYSLEAIYSFPVPRSASLAEVTLQMGESVLDGEVVAKQRAEQIYAAERDSGNQAGLAKQNGYQTFEFAVTPVLASSEATMRFVYYQPLEIDTGTGRYVYPLEEGGTDDAATQFWVTNDQVRGNFSIDVEVKSAWPLRGVRVPGYDSEVSVNRRSEGHYEVALAKQNAALDRDFVLYYALADDLPGRVEVIPYRADPSKPGTFMAVVTPGLDLGELQDGADYVFVLDTSGSMQGKLGTLADGVTRALGQMSPQDRFRVIHFSSSAAELLGGFRAATPEAVAEATRKVQGLASSGGTNIYEALELATRDLDADRATSVVLVTDGVTNTGVVDPRAFRGLLERYDLRVFGFLMGNGSNWPLMRTIADASGGFYAGVSNSDDIIGQILLAKSKITHEALHDAEFRLRGVRTSDVTGLEVGKVYRGQQLILFGRYHESGPATLELAATLTGQDRTYTTTFDFPEVDTENPELERLWAMAKIEELTVAADAGLLEPSESQDAVRDLGVQFQIVTDETSMLVVSDEAFERNGVERRNRERVRTERAAQTQRASAPIQNRRVDTQTPTYSQPAPRLGGGGGSGSLDPIAGLLVLAIGASAGWSGRRRKREPRADEPSEQDRA